MSHGVSLGATAPAAASFRARMRPLGEQVHSGPPVLDEADIRSWTGDKALIRGRECYERGLVRTGYRHDGGFRSRCKGSAERPYEIFVSFDTRGIASALCTCPAGTRGRCKHVAASLLAWVNDSKVFAPDMDLERRLHRYTEPELVALLCRVAARHPDVEDMLRLPLPADEELVDPDAVLRQVERIVDDMGRGFGAWTEVAVRLQELMEYATDYLANQKGENAATVYAAIANALMAHATLAEDQEPGISDTLEACCLGLAYSLMFQEDDAARRRCLAAMYQVYRWDVHRGASGPADAVPELFLALVRPDERVMLACWVRRDLPSGDDDDARWERRMLGGLLLDLIEDRVDDDTFLQTCRDTGRTEDLVDRLLFLDRDNEAAAAARRALDEDVLPLADRFVDHDKLDLAVQLVVERGGLEDYRTRCWLKDLARERGQHARALRLTMELFEQRPSVSLYREACDLAARLGVLDDVRESVRHQLVSDQDDAVLARIHLVDGELDEALDALAACPWPESADLSLEIAERVRDERPRDAVALQLRHAEHCVAQRTRTAYAEAAVALSEVRRLCNRLDEQDEWRGVIQSFRDRYPRLRALRDELERAGL